MSFPLQAVYLLKITFSSAFDVQNKDYVKSNIFTDKYKTMPMADGSLYDIPFKLIPAGETDVVLA